MAREIRRRLQAERDAFGRALTAYVVEHGTTPRVVWRAMGSDGVTVYGAGDTYPLDSGVEAVWSLPREVSE